MTKEEEITILKKRIELYQEIIKFKDMQLDQFTEKQHQLKPKFADV